MEEVAGRRSGERAALVAQSMHGVLVPLVVQMDVSAEPETAAWGCWEFAVEETLLDVSLPVWHVLILLLLYSDVRVCLPA